jgi:hypothetical protein
MALFRRKKRDSGGVTREGSSPRSPRQPGGYESAQRQRSPLGAGLERRWEEAWHRARAGLYK